MKHKDLELAKWQARVRELERDLDMFCGMKQVGNDLESDALDNVVAQEKEWVRQRISLHCRVDLKKNPVDTDFRKGWNEALLAVDSYIDSIRYDKS